MTQYNIQSTASVTQYPYMILHYYCGASVWMGASGVGTFPQDVEYNV